MEEEAVIVGAGICGLATAVALKRVGIRAVVLERASELRTTGAAILLWSNAWLALNALGVTDKLNLLYAPIERGFFTDVKTKSTQQVVYASKERDGPRAVHRKILLQVLADELPLDTIRFSSKLTSVESIVKDGHRISVLRLHDGAIIKAKRAAIIPLNDKEVYWFLVLQTTPEDKDIGNDPESIQRAVMENWAKDFPLSYLDIVQQSDLSTVSFASLMFRHMGNSLDPKGKLRPGDVGCALGKYVGERRWRTAWIIVGSYLSGWVQQDGSGWWMKFLRDLFYKTIQTRVINLVHYDCGRLPNRMGTSL
ncbi:hypothetical protein CRG98_046425 [Punica granatum]|uniref:FAD-binding domain-containing protein n=1 Tax=Punica granatum TaxID=22663 RepID=A0A2I0HN89_PUNGR|nr:hypothetical protein CRG98_046425 [Punica granatum]